MNGFWRGGAAISKRVGWCHRDGVCVCMGVWDENRQNTLWVLCDFVLMGAWKTCLSWSEKGWVLTRELSQSERPRGVAHFSATKLRGQHVHQHNWWSPDERNNKSIKHVLGGKKLSKIRKHIIWQTSRVQSGSFAGGSVCSLAFFPSRGFITTESVTADWHPDLNSYTSPFCVPRWLEISLKWIRQLTVLWLQMQEKHT